MVHNISILFYIYINGKSKELHKVLTMFKTYHFNMPV